MQRLPNRVFPFIWFFLRRNFWTMLLSVVFSSIAASLEVGTTYIIKLLIEAVEKTNATTIREIIQEFQPLIYLFIAQQLAVISGWRFSELFSMWGTTRIIQDMRISLFEDIQGNSYRFFIDNFSGNLTQKMNNIVNGIREIGELIQWQFGEHGVKIIAGVILLGFVYPPYAIASILWIIFYVLLFYFLLNPLERLSENYTEKMSAVEGQLVDIISNIVNIKYFSRALAEKVHLNRFANEERLAHNRSWLYGNFMRIFQAGTDKMFVIVMFLWLAVMYALKKVSLADTVMSFSLVLLISDYSWMVCYHLRDFIEKYGKVNEGLKTIMHEYEILDVPNADVLRVKEGGIEFKNMNFSYASHPPLFSDFHLSLQPGEKVALVGISGAGKSSFVNLLLRFYDLNSGKILIDGQNIAQVTQESLRNAIAVIPQDAILFHRSIRENIAYGKPEASEEEIMQAAKKAHAHDFITQLPKGYDTLVGERGVKLSGGQRQRIIIARAVLKNAPILILDEATSSLDSASERAIQEALVEVMDDKTVIAIAHRLSTIMHMDRIIVLEKGEIMEEGKHDELLAKGGLYAKLWNMQVSGFIP